MTSHSLVPDRTALLVMDYQVGILGGIGGGAAGILDRAGRVLRAAREAGMSVIFVKVCFRPGYPEIADVNRMFSTVKKDGRLAHGGPDTEIDGGVAPGKSDIVVMKRRVSAFAGTDVELILRARRIDTLVLAGVSTSGVVLSTVRHAADADYRIVVLGDCCADRDPEVHRVLLEKVFPRQAEVTTAEGFLGQLNAGQANEPH